MTSLQVCPALRYYVQQNCNQTRNNEADIQELLLIQKQSELISEIMKSTSGFTPSKVIYEEGSEFSLSTVENSRHLSVSKSTFELHKEQNVFTETSLDEALKEIKRYCSQKTFIFVREKFRSSDQNRISTRLEKEMKYNQQLMRRCLKLSHEVTELKMKLESTTEKLKLTEKSKTAKEQSMNLEKSEIFLKWEKSMLYKEKLQAQLKKYLNRQFSVLEEEKKTNESIRDEINSLLDRFQSFETNDLAEMSREVKIILSEQQNLSRKQKQQFHRVHDELQSIFKELRNAIGICK